MAKRKKPATSRPSRLTAAAERTGRALGRAARTYDAFRDEHPHPVEEAAEALARGQQRLNKITAAARARAAAIVKKAKAAAKKTRKAVKKTTKAAAKVTQKARKRLKR